MIILLQENDILGDDDAMIEFRRDVEDIVRGIKFVVGGTVDCFTHVSYISVMNQRYRSWY